MAVERTVQPGASAGMAVERTVQLKIDADTDTGTGAGAARGWGVRTKVCERAIQLEVEAV
ncbi:hypothetical protein GCM10010428_75150 [Actinosynnema pretiosum subsp. pretiosum]